MGELHGTVAVVTGGANGIGLACAEQFGRLGADLLLADTATDAFPGARERLAGTGRRVVTIDCDVTSDADTAALVEAAAAGIAPVGVLMLNAGISAGGLLEHVPLTQWGRLIEVNVLGVVRGLTAFLPAMIAAARPAHIVITGSTASLFGSAEGYDAPYVATKHALLGIARSYGAYLARHDITVQLLAPRMTDTSFPRSSTAWGRRGPRLTADREIGDADTPEQVAAVLASALGGPLVVATDPGAVERLVAFANNDVLATDPRSRPA